MLLKFSVLIVRESYNEKTIYPHLISLTPDAAAGADPDEKKTEARRPESRRTPLRPPTQ